MTDEGADHPDIEEFEAAARRAVDAAEAEARSLGHDRLGTEHLLLGILGDEHSPATRLLHEAGARLGSARHKVREARAGSPASTNPDGALARTSRADRALGRSVRYAHRRRSDQVTTEHLLVGVLDVEGTAGQVLRGLGVDVQALRQALEGDRLPAPDEGPAGGDRRPEAEAEPEMATAVCPSCGAGVARNLAYRVVRAGGDHGPRDAAVFSCGRCGRVLGVAPA